MTGYIGGSPWLGGLVDAILFQMPLDHPTSIQYTKTGAHTYLYTKNANKPVVDSKCGQAALI